MNAIKIRIVALLAAVKTYRASIAFQRAEAVREAERERFMEAAKSDPLSILFQAKYCQQPKD